MVLEFRSEMTLRFRLLLLLGAPFIALIASVMISFFGVFSREAYDLVAPIFGGDMTRFGDFLIYLVVLALSVGVSSIMIIAILYTTLVKPDHVVEIDPDSRTVNVYFLRVLPWQRSSSSSYRFDEIEAVELKYDDEGNEIRLRLPDRKLALTLFHEYSGRVSEKKLSEFKEMGLPTK